LNRAKARGANLEGGYGGRVGAAFNLGYGERRDAHPKLQEAGEGKRSDDCLGKVDGRRENMGLNDE